MPFVIYSVGYRRAPYADCHDAECRYADCHGTQTINSEQLKIVDGLKAILIFTETVL